MNVKSYSFSERYIMSSSTASHDDVKRVLLESIPGAIDVEHSKERDDKSGTDYWISHRRGAPISVDVKARSEDPIVTYNADDLALETWSVIDRKIGWTLDSEKRTDYVMWWFAPTRRWVLVPFAQLCSVFIRRLDEWLCRFETKQQKTPSQDGRSGWRSEMLLVPRKVVWAAIYEDFGGGATAANDNDSGSVRGPAANDNVNDCDPLAALRRYRERRVREFESNDVAAWCNARPHLYTERQLKLQQGWEPTVERPAVIGYARRASSAVDAAIVLACEPGMLRAAGLAHGARVDVEILGRRIAGVVESTWCVRVNEALPLGCSASIRAAQDGH